MTEQRTCKQDWVLTISIPCGISSSSGGTKGSGGGATTAGRGAGGNTVFWTSDVGKELSCWVLYNIDPRKRIQYTSSLFVIYVIIYVLVTVNLITCKVQMNVKSVQGKAKTCLVKHGLMLKGIMLHGLN